MKEIEENRLWTFTLFNYIFESHCVFHIYSVEGDFMKIAFINSKLMFIFLMFCSLRLGFLVCFLI